MKKTLYVLITCIFILSFIVCGTVQTSAASQTKTTTDNTTKTETTKSSTDDTKKTSATDDTKKSGDEIELYQKYEPLISMLEDGDFQGASNYVNNLKSEAKKKTNKETDDAPVIDIVVGTYIDPESGFTVTFNQDYTVEYDNSSETVRIDNLTNVQKDIDVKKDFSVLISPDGKNGRYVDFRYNDSLETYCLEMTDHKNKWHEMVKEDLLETVELTEENWEDYFEIADHVNCHRDAFGEVTDTFIGKKMVLRDGVRLYTGNGAVAFSFVEKEFNVVSVDEEEGTIELGGTTGNVRKSSENSANIQEEYSYGTSGEETTYFGCYVSNNLNGIDKNRMTVWLPDDIEVTRIEGTLYLVRDLGSQSEKEDASESEDGFVTVELDSENFEDYFEFVTMHKYNAFGEVVENCTVFGVRSKKYDEGLIVYSLDDIAVEYSYSGSSKGDSTLANLLYFGNETWSSNCDVVYGGRITEGKVTFIKKENIEEYDIPERKKPDDFAVTTTIQLKNGESIFRSLQPEYPY